MSEIENSAVEPPDQESGEIACSRRSRWWFPIAAIGLGVLPVLSLELLCHCFGWAAPDQEELGEFANIRPLFVRDSSGTKMTTAENRLGYFRPVSFDIAKSAHENRVFCLGGSTVQGRPYAVETSFTTWLQIGLTSSSPNADRWTIVNCGGVSYASYRLTPVLREVLRYQPDCIVLMTGHNEFLEDRELKFSERSSTDFRTAELLRRAFRSHRVEPRALLPEEVDALLDYEGGLEAYDLDLKWRDDVATQYERNLRAMIALCREAHVPLVMIAPVSNVRDIPPFKVAHGPNVTVDDLDRWQTACAAARAAVQETPPNLTAAAKHYERACETDPWHAGSWFELGRTYDALHRHAAAATAYQRAVDADVCPLRMTSALNAVLRRVSAETKTPLIDFCERIKNESRHGMVDSQWMLDHVHPTIAGHQLLAEQVRDWLVDSKEFDLAGDPTWRARAAADWKAHLQNLPASYFTEGAKRLSSLNRWARGRGDKTGRVFQADIQ